MTHRIITGTEAKALRENVAQIFAYPSAKVLITLCDLAFTVETLEAERDRLRKALESIVLHYDLASSVNAVMDQMADEARAALARVKASRESGK